MEIFSILFWIDFTPPQNFYKIFFVAMYLKNTSKCTLQLRRKFRNIIIHWYYQSNYSLIFVFKCNCIWLLFSIFVMFTSCLKYAPFDILFTLILMWTTVQKSNWNIYDRWNQAAEFWNVLKKRKHFFIYMI